MKKMYLIFSLLLMILGINTVYAGVTWGGSITDPSTLTNGSKIAIHTNQAQNAANQTYTFLSALQDNIVYTTMSELSMERYAVFTMETAAGKTVKNEQAYYLKNDYNGKYVTYVFVDAPESDGGSVLEDGSLEMRLQFTDDINNATPIIIKSLNSAVDWFGYKLTAADQEKVSETTMMIIAECKEKNNQVIGLNSNFSAPYIASYGDWAAWWEVSEPIVTEAYLEDLASLYEKVKDLNYKGGTAPGCYDETLIANYEKAKEDARYLVLEALSPTEEEAKACLEALEDAYFSVLNADEAPVHEGYFRIQNAYPGFIETQGEDAIMTMFATNNGKMQWKKYDENDATMVWKFIDRKDGTWLLYNVGTGQYVSGVSGGQYVLSNDSTNNSIKFTSLGQSQFNIFKPGYNAMHTESHASGAGKSGNIVVWNGGLNTASAWYVTNVAEEQIPGFEAIGDQNMLNRELEVLYNKANEKYAIGSRFKIEKDTAKWLVKLDDLKNDPGVVYSNSDHNTQNPSSPDGQGYEGLLDADSVMTPSGSERTYWHSNWTNIIENGYLQFKLNKPVSAFAVSLLRRKNINQATEIYFAVTNDTINGEWTSVGSITGLAANTEGWADSLLTYQSNGFDLGGSYQYVRVTWKSARNFTHFAGFHFQEAVLDPECQNAKMGELANNLKSELIKASKLLSENKATREAINSLTEAYNAYIAVLADPTELKAKLDSITKVANYAATPSMKAQDGSDEFTAGYPGVYTDDAKNALLAAVADAQSYVDANDGSGTYEKDQIAAYLEKLNTALATFKATAPELNVTTADKNGVWYYLSASQHYFNVTGNAQNTAGEGDNLQIRKGRLYVNADLVNDPLNDAKINVTGNKTLDELGVSDDFAKWRFVSMGDTAVAIQNKGTGLYIGQKTVGNAGLSITPTAFKVSELGYATFLLEGYRYNGETINPLHVQTEGQVIVFWANKDLGGGSCFDIEPTNEEASSINTTPNIEYVISGKLYAKCYPVSASFAGDNINFMGAAYEIATIDQDKKELTLTAAEDDYIEAGKPFFYIAGGDEIVASQDTTLMFLELADDKVIAPQPKTVNGLVGNYYPTEVAAGFGIIKDEEGVQSIGATGKNEEIGWNTAYIDASQIQNAGQPGEIVVSLSGDLTTSIKDAILNAQLGNVNVYSIDGILIKKNVKASEAVKGLAKGIYIIGNKKVAVQ
jgi:hypothetical protein